MSVDESEPSGLTQVACVIPTHGRPELLERALRSVLAQDLRPAEVVVVDDLDQIEVEELVEASGDASVSYLALRTNSSGTAGASRNAGAAATEAPVLAFLDDDDTWDSRFLRSAVDLLLDDAVDMVVSWNRFERDGRRLDVLRRMPDRLDAKMLPAVNPGLNGSNFVMKREVFERLGGFDPALPVFNDLDLLVRFAQAGGTHSVVREELVTQYGHDGEQLSSRTPRRAAGIRTYAAKHRSALHGRARRRLLREIWMTERHPGQPLHRRVGYFVLSWVVAEPREVGIAISRRLRRQPRAY